MSAGVVLVAACAGIVIISTGTLISALRGRRR